MKKVMMCLTLTAMLLTAGCSAGQQGSVGSPSADHASSTAAAKSKVQVKAAHIAFELPETWSFKGSGESFALEQDGKPAGALDGMGYSDTIEGLFPNGAEIEQREQLPGFPVKVERVQLSTEAAKEIHYYFILPDAKAIYDLRFDADKVTPDESLEIAKTAVITN